LVPGHSIVSEAQNLGRILMLVERFPPDLGGLAQSGARIAGCLVRLGHQVELVCWTRSCPPGSLESVEAGGMASSAEGAVLHRIGRYASQDFTMQHSLNVLDWLHDEEPFDLVWGHYLHPAGFLAVFFAERHSLPSVVSARGNDVDRLMFPPGDFARLTWTLGRASRIACVSRDLAKKVAVLRGSEADVEVHPNSVDTDLFSPGAAPAGLREGLGIAPEEAVLVFAGELRMKKGIPFLFEALVELRETRPACLLVIGEVRRRDQNRLASFAADRPEDAARVIVTGHLEEPREVAAHLRLADVFLHPSLWDGLPNAVLEAMASGCIVLASDAGGIPDCIEHGRSGYLIPKHQLHRLGEALKELLERPAADLAALSEAARSVVCEGFQPGCEEARLGALLQGLLGDPREA